MASGSKKVIIAALIGNSLIAITKFIATFLTGSSAMLSEGIHSVVDTGNQVLLLFGLKQARKPADWNHPYGHGKEVYFWSFVVAIIIFGLGAGISIYEGIHSVFDPHPVESPMTNYIVLSLAMIFEAFAWYYAWKEFSKTKGNQGYVEAIHKEKDPTTFVVLFEDSAAMMGLLVAFFGIFLAQMTGNPIYDGMASIFIGVILALTATWLAYETKGLLIGESAHGLLEEDLRLIISGHPGIEDINDLLTLHMGPDYILLTMNINFSDHLNTTDIEEITAELTKSVKNKYPRIKRVFLEAEG